MRNDAAAFPNPFLAYKQAGTALTLRGKEKVGERDAYVLIAEPKSGSTTRPTSTPRRFFPSSRSRRLKHYRSGSSSRRRNCSITGTSFPDILVRTTIDDIRAGRDPVLEPARRCPARQ
jgi:hypothetical protein